MSKLIKTVTIDAPLEKVFAYMADPNHMPVIWPGMIKVTYIKQSPLGGFNYGCVSTMAGLHFTDAFEVVDFIVNRRISMKSTTGIKSTFTWNFEPKEAGTNVSVEAEYIGSFPLFGKVVELVLSKADEHDLALTLLNLKARMEVLAIKGDKA